jgi:hypothetical protein
VENLLEPTCKRVLIIKSKSNQEEVKRVIEKFLILKEKYNQRVDLYDKVKNFEPVYLDGSLQKALSESVARIQRSRQIIKDEITNVVKFIKNFIDDLIKDGKFPLPIKTIMNKLNESTVKHADNLKKIPELNEMKIFKYEASGMGVITQKTLDNAKKNIETCLNSEQERFESFDKKKNLKELSKLVEELGKHMEWEVAVDNYKNNISSPNRKGFHANYAKIMLAKETSESGKSDLANAVVDVARDYGKEMGQKVIGKIESKLVGNIKQNEPELKSILVKNANLSMMNIPGYKKFIEEIIGILQQNTDEINTIYSEFYEKYYFINNEDQTKAVKNAEDEIKEELKKKSKKSDDMPLDDENLKVLRIISFGYAVEILTGNLSWIEEIKDIANRLKNAYISARK